MSHRFFRFGIIISTYLLLSIFLLGACVSYAASSNFYLEIKGIDGAAMGYQKIVHCAAGGHIKLDGLKAGRYSIQIVHEDGTAIPALDASSKDAAKMTVKSQDVPDRVTLMITVRKAGKGRQSGEAQQAAMPTGRRMHKPITITKEIDKASPSFFTVAASDVDADGSEEVTFTFRQIEW